jgi:hypothetical protein
MKDKCIIIVWKRYVCEVNILTIRDNVSYSPML